MTAAEQFNILTVCTGNICRSPAAERLLASEMGGQSVHVTSAGTGAMAGYPIEPSMAELLRSAGVPTGDFAARQVTPALLREADLVLPLSTHHRAELVRMSPAILRRAFTLLEFARIVGTPEFTKIPAGNVVERLRFMVDAASRHRLLGEVINDDNVPDPYRRGPEVFESSFAMIKDAVDVIVRVARG